MEVTTAASHFVVLSFSADYSSLSIIDVKELAKSSVFISN